MKDSYTKLVPRKWFSSLEKKLPLVGLRRGVEREGETLLKYIGINIIIMTKSVLRNEPHLK